jgi:hypothetical protein
MEIRGYLSLEEKLSGGLEFCPMNAEEVCDLWIFDTRGRRRRNRPSIEFVQRAGNEEAVWFGPDSFCVPSSLEISSLFGLVHVGFLLGHDRFP